MGAGFDMRLVSSALREAERVDYFWQDGRMVPGMPPGGVEAAQQLRVMRRHRGAGDLIGVLRIILRPVVFIDDRFSGAEARVHMFRYQDGSGGEWTWSYCVNCGGVEHRPYTGWPVMLAGCPWCGSVRSAVECRGWHLYGECPDCLLVKSLPLVEPEGETMVESAARWRARRDGVKVAAKVA